MIFFIYKFYSDRIKTEIVFVHPVSVCEQLKKDGKPTCRTIISQKTWI